MVDKVDYAILTVLEDTDSPLWKKRIHTAMTEQEDKLPGHPDVSTQTIGRRVDTLHDNALIQSSIVSPEDLKRDLIIAYTLTAEGEAALKEKREQLMEDCAAADTCDKPVMIHLLTYALALSPDEQERLKEWRPDNVRALIKFYDVRRYLNTEADLDEIIGFIENIEEETSKQFVTILPAPSRKTVSQST